MSHLIELFVHLDRHLADVTAAYGAWIYGLLFLIIFCETGLVVTPFLPGDSSVVRRRGPGGAGVI